VTTSADASSILWSLDERRALVQFPAGGQVRSALFTPDSRRLITSDETGIVYIWDIETGSLIDSFEQTGRDAIRDMALHDDTLVIAGASDALTLWSVTTQPAPGEVVGQQDERVAQVAYAPDGQTIASGGGNRDDTGVYLWDSITGDVTQLTGHDAPITGLMYSLNQDGRLVSTDEAGRVFIWQDGEQIGTIESDEPFFAVFYRGKTLALGSNTGEIVLWDVSGASDTWQPVRTIDAHDSRITALAVSGDGTLASASLSDVIQVHDMATGDLLQTLTGHTDTVQSLAFAGDNITLASGSRDRTIRLWDTTTGTESADPLRGHEGWVMTLAFSPDRRVLPSGTQETLLASGGNDGQLLLWDMQALRQIGMPLTGHTDWVNSVAFSSDGARLASGGNDGQVLNWITSLSGWQEAACTLADRSLSVDERQRYFRDAAPSDVCSD
jgi:WD40 repeat protein